MHEMQSRLVEEQKQRSSLTEKVDGLSWKVTELTDLQEELEEVRNELYKVKGTMNIHVLKWIIQNDT